MGKLLRTVALPACCLHVGLITKVSVDVEMSYQLVMTGDSKLLLVGANGELSLAVAHVEFNGDVSGYKDDF